MNLEKYSTYELLELLDDETISNDIKKDAVTMINRKNDPTDIENVYREMHIKMLNKSKTIAELKLLKVQCLDLEGVCKYLSTDLRENTYSQRFRDLIETIDAKIQFRETKKKVECSLTATEIAIKHEFLCEAKIEKRLNSSSEVGKKYSHLKNKTNIEKAHAKIGKTKITSLQLKNVFNDLYEYPEAQKLVKESIDKLS